MPKGICVGVLLPDQGSRTCAKGTFKCLKIIFDRTTLHSHHTLYITVAAITVPYSDVPTSMSSASLWASPGKTPCVLPCFSGAKQGLLPREPSMKVWHAEQVSECRFWRQQEEELMRWRSFFAIVAGRESNFMLWHCKAAAYDLKRVERSYLQSFHIYTLRWDLAWGEPLRTKMLWVRNGAIAVSEVGSYSWEERGLWEVKRLSR